jgi:hypothetical protein
LFFYCCDSVAALALANCNEHEAEAIITAPAHAQRSLHGARIPKGKSGKITVFSIGIHARVPPAFSVSRAKLPNGFSYLSPLLPALFLSRASRLQAASSQKILHMQAGQ